jgi:hypothetical protein
MFRPVTEESSPIVCVRFRSATGKFVPDSLYRISDNRLRNDCEGLTQQLIVLHTQCLENGSATAQPIQGAYAVYLLENIVWKPK